MRSTAMYVLLLTLIAPAPAQAQACDSEEARHLDFWLGEWTLAWEGGGGTNHITRRFGDCVIEENFEGDMPTGKYFGHSVSVWNPRIGKWQQTWVDSQGGYLQFTGGVGEDGVMRLFGAPNQLPDGRTQHTRMSWVDVQEDAFDWHWERSFDGGTTWEMVWLIRYERR